MTALVLVLMFGNARYIPPNDISSLDHLSLESKMLSALMRAGTASKLPRKRICIAGPIET